MSLGTSKIVRIAASDRTDDPTATTTDFTVELGNNQEMHKIRRMVLKSCEFCNCFYNVNSATGVAPYAANNIFTFFEDTVGLVNTAPIPEGFYTANQLITALTAAMNLVLSVGNTVTITLGIDSKFQFLMATNAINLVSSAGSNIMASLIGITDTTVAFANPALVQGLPALQGLTEVFIESPELARANLCEDRASTKSWFINIPIEAAYGETNFYDSRDDELNSKNYQTPQDLRRITFRLRDRQNNIVNLQNKNWKMVWKAYY
jgi:hypothetical protein